MRTGAGTGRAVMGSLERPSAARNCVLSVANRASTCVCSALPASGAKRAVCPYAATTPEPSADVLLASAIVDAHDGGGPGAKHAGYVDCSEATAAFAWVCTSVACNATAVIVSPGFSATFAGEGFSRFRSATPLTYVSDSGTRRLIVRRGVMPSSKPSGSNVRCNSSRSRNCPADTAALLSCNAVRTPNSVTPSHDVDVPPRFAEKRPPRGRRLPAASSRSSYTVHSPPIVQRACPRFRTLASAPAPNRRWADAGATDRNAKAANTIARLAVRGSPAASVGTGEGYRTAARGASVAAGSAGGDLSTAASYPTAQHS